MCMARVIENMECGSNKYCYMTCLLRHSFLAHWGRDKMNTISQTTFSGASPWMKMFEFRIKFHGSFFLGVQLTIKPLSEPMMVSLLTHICVTWPQWVIMGIWYMKACEAYCFYVSLTNVVPQAMPMKPLWCIFNIYLFLHTDRLYVKFCMRYLSVLLFFDIKTAQVIEICLHR